MNEGRTRPGAVSRIVRAGALLLLLLFSVAAGLAAWMGGYFGAAYITGSPAGLIAVGAVALLITTGGISFLAARALGRRTGRSRFWVPASVTGGTLGLALLAWSALVLEPMDVEFVAMEPTEDTRYWDLPNGSRIAYWVTPANGTAYPAPVIFLHGGPGAPGSLSLGEVGDVLASAGFNAYHYHQVGSGLSSRLEDVSEYTLDRHVADLEAIRQEIGAERLILVGGSWGGTLAAHYMARHPTRVERAVFASPGAIWSPAWAGTGDSPVPESDGSEMDVVVEAITPRFAAVYGLLRINPRAAQNLASDEEMSGFFQPLLAQIIAGDVVVRNGGAQADLPEEWVPAGFGFYAMMMTTQSLQGVHDPRDRLRELETPVLVLRGEYDRIREEVHREYEEVFTNSELLVVEGAAHSVSASPRYPEILEEFLTGGQTPWSQPDRD